MDSEPVESGRPPALIEIRRGGAATPEEVAALVVALTPSGGGEGDGREARPLVPAWTAAALSEGVGGPRVDGPGAIASSGTRAP